VSHPRLESQHALDLQEHFNAYAPSRDDSRMFCQIKPKMAGSDPGICISSIRLCLTAAPQRGGAGAGRGRRQRGSAAVEQRRDAADGDAPVDAARPVGLLLQILLAIALRGQVFRRTPNCWVRSVAADSARRSDSDRLSTSLPTASVWPSIRNTSRGLAWTARLSPSAIACSFAA